MKKVSGSVDLSNIKINTKANVYTPGDEVALRVFDAGELIGFYSTRSGGISIDENGAVTVNADEGTKQALAGASDLHFELYNISKGCQLNQASDVKRETSNAKDEGVKSETPGA